MVVVVVSAFMDCFQSGWTKGTGATRIQLRSARARRGRLFLLRVAVLLLITAALLFAGVVAAAGAVVMGVLEEGVVFALGIFALAAATVFRARSVADSSVRTNVPVSARGTTLWAASAASCGVTPTVVGLVGTGVVCAIAPVAANDNTALASKVDRDVEKDCFCIRVLLRSKHSAVGHSRDRVRWVVVACCAALTAVCCASCSQHAAKTLACL